MKDKVSEKKYVVLGKGFTYMAIWRARFQKKRCGPWSGLHLHGTMKAQFQKEVWSSVRASLPWQYEGQGFRKGGLKKKEGWFFHQAGLSSGLPLCWLTLTSTLCCYFAVFILPPKLKCSPTADWDFACASVLLHIHDYTYSCSVPEWSGICILSWWVTQFGGTDALLHGFGNTETTMIKQPVKRAKLDASGACYNFRNTEANS